MPDFAPVALLVMSLADSLPPSLRPLHAIDDACLAYTVAQAVDTLHVWRLPAGVTVEAVIESPGEGEVLVLFVPRDGEDQSTGVDVLPPNPTPSPHRGEPDGWCGRLFSIEWR